MEPSGGDIRRRAGPGGAYGDGRQVAAEAPSPPVSVRPEGKSADQETRPYQTLLVQIFCSFTTSPVFGACQILPLPA